MDDLVARLLPHFDGCDVRIGEKSFMRELLAEAAARITALEAENARLSAEKAGLVEVLDAAWKFATQMRNASKLVGPYENDRKATAIWQRSLYHEGRDLQALLKPARAALEQHGGKTDG